MGGSCVTAHCRVVEAAPAIHVTVAGANARLVQRIRLAVVAAVLRIPGTRIGDSARAVIHPTPCVGAVRRVAVVVKRWIRNTQRGTSTVGKPLLAAGSWRFVRFRRRRRRRRRERCWCGKAIGAFSCPGVAGRRSFRRRRNICDARLQQHCTAHSCNETNHSGPNHNALQSMAQYATENVGMSRGGRAQLNSQLGWSNTTVDTTCCVRHARNPRRYAALRRRLFQSVKTHRFGDVGRHDDKHLPTAQNTTTHVFGVGAKDAYTQTQRHAR